MPTSSRASLLRTSAALLVLLAGAAATPAAAAPGPISSTALRAAEAPAPDLVVRRVAGGTGVGPANDTAIRPVSADAVGEVTWFTSLLNPPENLPIGEPPCLTWQLQRVDEAGDLSTLLVAGCGLTGADGPQTMSVVKAESETSALFLDGSARLWRWSEDVGVQLVAGTGVRGSSGNGGPALLAQISVVGEFEPLPGGGVVMLDDSGVREISADGRIDVAHPTRLATGLVVTPDGTTWLQLPDRVLSRSPGGSWVLRAGGGPSWPEVGRIATEVVLDQGRPFFVSDGVLRVGWVSVDVATGLVSATGTGPELDVGSVVERSSTTSPRLALDDAGQLVLPRWSDVLRERDGVMMVVAGGPFRTSGDGRLAVDAVLRTPPFADVDALGDDVLLVDGEGLRQVAADGTISTRAWWIGPLESTPWTPAEGTSASDTRLPVPEAVALRPDGTALLLLRFAGTPGNGNTPGTQIWTLDLEGRLDRLAGGGRAAVTAGTDPSTWRLSLESFSRVDGGLLVSSRTDDVVQTFLLDPRSGDLLSTAGTGDPADGTLAPLQVPEGSAVHLDDDGPAWFVDPWSGAFSRADACGVTRSVLPAGRMGLLRSVVVGNGHLFLVARTATDRTERTYELMGDGALRHVLTGTSDYLTSPTTTSAAAEGWSEGLAVHGDDLLVLDDSLNVLRSVEGATADPGPWATDETCSAGELVPIAPFRLEDTRLSTSSGVAPGTSRRVVVAGRGGVPSTAVGAVLNVTATDVRGPGHLRVHPSGSPLPATSSLSTVGGSDRAVSVTSGLGADGAVEVYNGGTTPLHLVVDVSGWTTAPGVRTQGGSVVDLVAPQRLLDTRYGVGRAGTARQPAGAVLTLPVAGPGRAAPAGATAVVLNLTATEAAYPGHVTAWGSGAAPLASNLNVGAGQTVPNLAVVPVGTDGSVRLSTSTPVHLVADLIGWYTPADGGTGGRVETVDPQRLWDSRDDELPVQAGEEVDVPVLGTGAVPATGVSGVLLNVTGVDPSAPTHVTVWPGEATAPTTSSLNLVPGLTAANAVWSAVSSDGTISVRNNAGQVDLIVDVVGWVTDDGLWQP